jgi:hypothetical protein
MWLLRASPWQGDLLDMLDSMRGRLERIQRLPPMAGVGEESEAADDTAELVLVLERLIGRRLGGPDRLGAVIRPCCSWVPTPAAQGEGPG